MADIIALTCLVVAAALAVTAAIEDTRTHLLRDVYTLPLITIAVVGLPIAALLGDRNPGPALVDMAIGASFFAGPWLITHLLAPQQIGFGDIKLAVGLGLLLGWIDPAVGFVGFFTTSIAFGVFAVASRVRPHDAVPFGPGLVAGATLTLMYRAVA